MPTPRGTKLRSFPVTKPAPLPSRSRPTKPPAKVLSSRKAAALGSGGGKLTPWIRKKLDREPTPRRVREPREETPVRTRAGKREPTAARLYLACARSRQHVRSPPDRMARQIEGLSGTERRPEIDAPKAPPTCHAHMVASLGRRRTARTSPRSGRQLTSGASACDGLHR